MQVPAVPGIPSLAARLAHLFRLAAGTTSIIHLFSM